MDWQNLLGNVSKSVNDIAGVWSQVQNTRTNVATSKAQAQIDRATVEANREIALATIDRAKAVSVAPAAPSIPGTVINTATGMSPTVLLIGLAVLGGGFYLLTRKG